MKKSIIKQAKNKDEAIRLGLSEIGKSRSEVEIEVLEEGSAGFLGLGSKDAVVRISYDEDMSASLFDLESEIKRDSMGVKGLDNEYRVSERSKYYSDEAASNYEKEENQEVPSRKEEIERAGEQFDRSIDYIRDNPEDNLGEYGRFERINEYEKNATGKSHEDVDLSIEFERRMDAIDDDGFEIKRNEYVEETPEPVIEETTDEDIIEESNVVSFDEGDDSSYKEDRIIERTHIEPNSTMTFGSTADTNSRSEIKESEDIAEDFTGAHTSENIAQQKQKSDIDKYYEAKEFLEEILKAMHFENASVIGNLEGNTIKLDAKVDENDTGIAIGKGGMTLDAIELIIRKSIDSRGNNLRVNVDINNYKKRRDEKIKELAADTARKVQRSKKSWNLKYMNSYERRLAHEEISKFPNVASHSEGQEPKRYVVVSFVGDEEE